MTVESTAPSLVAVGDAGPEIVLTQRAFRRMLDGTDEEIIGKVSRIIEANAAKPPFVSRDDVVVPQQTEEAKAPKAVPKMPRQPKPTAKPKGR